MNWVLFAQLLPYGIQFAEFVYQRVTTGGDVTPNDIAQLKALAANTAPSQILAAAARAGIDPNNPLVLQLLGMAPPPASPS